MNERLESVILLGKNKRCLDCYMGTLCRALARQMSFNSTKQHVNCSCPDVEPKKYVPSKSTIKKELFIFK